MLLLIDFLALRSREYHSIIRLYQDWEVSFVAVVVVFPALFFTSTSVCGIVGCMYACNRHGHFFDDTIQIVRQMFACKATIMGVDYGTCCTPTPP